MSRKKVVTADSSLIGNNNIYDSLLGSLDRNSKIGSRRLQTSSTAQKEVILTQKLFLEKYKKIVADESVDTSTTIKRKAQILSALEMLDSTEITVELLKETMIGATVNSYRKETGKLGQVARKLRDKWKSMYAASASETIGNERSTSAVKIKQEKNRRSEISSETVEAGVQIKNGNNVCDEPSFADVIQSANSAAMKHREGSSKHPHSSGKKRHMANNEMKSHVTIYSTGEDDPNHNGFSSTNTATASKDFASAPPSVVKSEFPDNDFQKRKSHHKSKKHKKDKSKEKEEKRKRPATDCSEEKNGKRKAMDSLEGSAVSFSDALSYDSSTVSKKKRTASKTVTSTNQPPLPSEILGSLPELSTDYKPLPRIQQGFDSRHNLSGAPLVEELELGSKSSGRTAVYSGRKKGTSQLLSLYQLSMQCLMNNIDDIGYVGGVPYDILKPVLERCTATQLFCIEDYNPDFISETDELWATHCSRDFKGSQLQEFESWREMYLRLFEERERKFESLKAKIANKQQKTIDEAKKAKVAYTSSICAPKPPRDVLRAQIKYGTASGSKESGARAAVRMREEGRSMAAASHSKVKTIAAAPLMKKTKKLMSRMHR